MLLNLIIQLHDRDEVTHLYVTDEVFDRIKKAHDECSAAEDKTIVTGSNNKEIAKEMKRRGEIQRKNVMDMEDKINAILDDESTPIVKRFTTQTLCIDEEELPAVKRIYSMFLC